MSSRLFVKNLPKHATDASLKEFFSSQGGQVTDSKVLLDPVTKASRRAGFVGFRSEDEAQHALRYFDKTYMTTSKLQVTLAKPVGSEDLLQFKKKRELSKKRPKGAKGEETSEEVVEEEEDDAVGKEAGDRKRIKKDPKHEQFLKLMRPNRENKDEETESEEERKVEGKSTGGVEEEALKSDRVFVRNLPYTCSKEDLVQYFDGLPVDVVLPVDAFQKPKGFAILRFSSAVQADEVLKKYQAKPKQFQGRLLHVLPAQPERTPVADPSAFPGTTGAGKPRHHAGYKEEREAERRKLAGTANDTKTWHGLFLRGDAAAGAMATSLGISKRDLVLGDGDEDDAAIRVAMSEARIIQENKSFLQAQGVDLAALQLLVASNNKQEPTTVLLAKNLPDTASEAELKTMFAKIGTLHRFVMPPSRTLALIAYHDAPDAKRAMATLAYSRYKSSPLYLQYAPASLMRNLAAAATTTTTATVVEPEEPMEDLTASSVLFVKNLEWSVTEASLQTHLASLGVPPQHVSIPKRAGKKAGEELSSGFGFCQFPNPEAANRALKKLHGSTLLGHTLDVQLSAPKSSGNSGAGGKKSTATKLVVRNLAFEATKKDVQKLFGAAAQVKSVRLPKKMDGTTRGFAFVEFTSHQQAKLAKQALESAHLYGRRLVAEFAETAGDEDENVANERRKMRE
ncbi:hypothetical protein BASA81_005480 [Batrachochytrium salamandrivorans]|nr:hypothetical protein BASA81_005480 [Batrachochytrium salamandrivorans]